MSKKIGYLKAFCRNGRIMIANSHELNELLKDKKDYFMILPFLIETEDVQIREIDAEEFKNLLPNAILTSMYEPKFDNVKTEEGKSMYMNSIPFCEKKLKKGAKRLNDMVRSWFLNLFNS